VTKLRLLMLFGAAAGALLLAIELPEIQRYLRIERM